VIHSGTAPLDDSLNRDFISIFYNLSWLKPTIQCAGPNAKKLNRCFQKANNKRMLRLLGKDLDLSIRNDTGFLESDNQNWLKWIAEDDALAGSWLAGFNRA